MTALVVAIIKDTGATAAKNVDMSLNVGQRLGFASVEMARQDAKTIEATKERDASVMEAE